MVYSFWSVGYHWSLEYFLEDILSVTRPNGLAVFMVPNTFSPFPGLKNRRHRLLTFKTANLGTERFLLIGPHEPT